VQLLCGIVNAITALRAVCDMHVAHEAPSGEYEYECVVRCRNKFCKSQQSLLPSLKSRDTKTRTIVKNPAQISFRYCALV